MLVFVLSAAKQQQSAIHMIILVDLELIGDNGGDVGAGVSASSSSSSPHSSSLSGVMLLPSHTEWIDTWKDKVFYKSKQKKKKITLLICMFTCPNL